MDRAKYRGKRVHGGGWVHGCYAQGESHYHSVARKRYFIIPFDAEIEYDKYGSCEQVSFIEVDPATVSQWTGETTKDGTDVYVIDCVDSGNKDCCWDIGLVMRRNSAFRVHAFCLFELIDAGCKVVGNSIDNPELLKETGEKHG